MMGYSTLTLTTYQAARNPRHCLNWIAQNPGLWRISRNGRTRKNHKPNRRHHHRLNNCNRRNKRGNSSEKHQFAVSGGGGVLWDGGGVVCCWNNYKFRSRGHIWRHIFYGIDYIRNFCSHLFLARGFAGGGVSISKKRVTFVTLSQISSQPQNAVNVPVSERYRRQARQ